jgi:hypothetical protein
VCVCVFVCLFVIVCDLEISKLGGPGLIWAVAPQKNSTQLGFHTF